jgi:hypothetical protein
MLTSLQQGLSPEECAAQYGVTLPPDFQTLATAAPTAAPSSIPAAGTVNVSVSYVPTASAEGGNNTISTPTSPVLFTGAANFNNNADVRGIAAVVLGALGMLGLVL